MTSELRTTISPRSPAGSRVPESASMMPTWTSGAGRPADARRRFATVPSGSKCSAGGSIETIIGASVCPNNCAITGPMTSSACSSRAVDIGAAPYQKHCSDDRSAVRTSSWSSSM
jgi:hypothetical protein